MEQNLLRTGYVMVSRALLMSMCEKQAIARNDEEAFLRVLLYVNYRDAVVLCNGVQVKCSRGESVISYKGWADILGWTRGHTRRFFERCFIDKQIEQVEGDCPSHIRIPNYDAWTGRLAGVKKPGDAEKKVRESAMIEELKLFVNQYSAITHLPPDSVEHVLVYWKKLTTAERKSAMEHIGDYYYGLNNTNFCYQASKYLEYKVFNNDFPKHEPVIVH